MLQAEISVLSKYNNSNVYSITCPRCGTTKIITKASVNTICSCKINLGNYLPILEHQYLRLKKHIEGDY